MHSRVWEMTWVLRDACASGPSSPEDARALWKAVGRRRERVRSRLGAEGRGGDQRLWGRRGGADRSDKTNSPSSFCQYQNLGWPSSDSNKLVRP